MDGKLVQLILGIVLGACVGAVAGVTITVWMIRREIKRAGRTIESQDPDVDNEPDDDAIKRGPDGKEYVHTFSGPVEVLRPGRGSPAIRAKVNDGRCDGS